MNKNQLVLSIYEAAAAARREAGQPVDDTKREDVMAAVMPALTDLDMENDDAKAEAEVVMAKVLARFNNEEKKKDNAPTEFNTPDEKARPKAIKNSDVIKGMTDEEKKALEDKIDGAYSFEDRKRNSTESKVSALVFNNKPSGDYIPEGTALPFTEEDIARADFAGKKGKTTNNDESAKIEEIERRAKAGEKFVIHRKEVPTSPAGVKIKFATADDVQILKTETLKQTLLSIALPVLYDASTGIGLNVNMMQKTKDDSLEVEVYSKLSYKGVAEAIEKNLIEYTKKETGEKSPAAKLPIEDTFKIGATDANGAFKKAKKGGYEQRTVRLSVTAADLVPVFELLPEYEAADFKAGIQAAKINTLQTEKEMEEAKNAMLVFFAKAQEGVMSSKELDGINIGKTEDNSENVDL